jgi:Sodium/hydrogen exchanger family
LDVLLSGGLSTSFSSLKANLFLSLAVATTGVCLPIGLSFSLLHLVNATALQAFAAGAALCSTSLGTTFTVLKTSDLTKTRLGVVLASAAMMDDVVGLVMVQIISNLKPGGTALSATTVIRPIFLSLAFAIVVPLCCRLIVLPGWRRLESSKSLKGFKQVLRRQTTAFVIHTSLLLGFVTGASYAGTSNLFAAYLAGTVISWWDTVDAPTAGQRQLSSALSADTTMQDNVPRNCAGPEEGERTETLQQEMDCQVPSKGPLTCDTISESPIFNRAPSGVLRASSKATQTVSKTAGMMLQVFSTTGVAVYEQYYLVLVERILKPLFFVGPTQEPPLPLHMLSSASGLHRFFDPHLPNVPRPGDLARNCLCLSHGHWQVVLRSLACPLRHQIHISLTPQGQQRQNQT